MPKPLPSPPKLVRSWSGHLAGSRLDVDEQRGAEGLERHAERAQPSRRRSWDITTDGVIEGWGAVAAGCPADQPAASNSRNVPPTARGSRVTCAHVKRTTR